MEWIGTVLSWIGLAIILMPLAMLLLTFFVLVPLAHLAPAAETLSRTRFFCPFSKRNVNVTFLNRAGATTPEDVVGCSRFSVPEHMTCEKRCLEMVETHAEPSPMVARFALLADGEANREVS